MNYIDQLALGSLNSFSGASPLFDTTVHRVAVNDLFKGMFFMTLLWWAWLEGTGKLIAKDLFAIRTIGGALLAIVVARTLQIVMPMRVRPLHNPEIDFTIPFSVAEDVLIEWSAFPSDHAVLFFALSTALWWKSWKLGVFACAWSLVVICLPRVYMGLHYPTDIIVGAVIGIGIMLVALYLPLPATAWTFLDRIQRRHVAWLYAAVFLISAQVATLFVGIRRLAEGFVKVILALA